MMLDQVESLEDIGIIVDFFADAGWEIEITPVGNLSIIFRHFNGLAQRG